MRRPHALLAGLALTLVAIPAFAARHHIVDQREFDPQSSASEHRRIYPRWYDGVRAYYGGRGDDRWRWGDDRGTTPYLGAPITGWYGGTRLDGWGGW